MAKVEHNLSQSDKKTKTVAATSLTTSLELQGVTCSICGDNANGYHYGAVSCEACKAFFKRTVQDCLSYECHGKNQCLVNKLRRKQCQFCRFQYCLRAGMRKEAVRKNRRPGAQNVKVLKMEIISALSPKPDTAATPLTTCMSKSDVSDVDWNELILLLEEIEPCEFEIDVNETLERGPVFFADVISKSSDIYLRNLVLWAKKIPSFQQLVIEDQMLLLQNNWMELETLLMSSFSLPYHGYIHVSRNFFVHESEAIALYHTPPAIDLTFRKMLKRMMQYNLTNREILCLKVINLFDSYSNCTWSNVNAIRSTQDYFMSLLIHLTGEDRRHLCRIMEINSLLCHLKIQSFGYWRSIVQQKESLPQPLLNEMLMTSLRTYEGNLA